MFVSVVETTVAKQLIQTSLALLYFGNLQLADAMNEVTDDGQVVRRPPEGCYAVFQFAAKNRARRSSVRRTMEQMP